MMVGGRFLEQQAMYLKKKEKEEKWVQYFGRLQFDQVNIIKPIYYGPNWTILRVRFSPF